jgi:hypothetical protein
MYFDSNISENKYGKKNEGSYLSCVTNGEFYFSLTLNNLHYIVSDLRKAARPAQVNEKREISVL